MELLFVLAGAALGFFIGWLLRSNRQKLPDPSMAGIPIDQHQKLQEELAGLHARFEQVKGERIKNETDLLAEREKLFHANTRLAKAEEAFKFQNEKMLQQQKEIEDLQKKFITEFENIANRLLEEKSKKFTEQNKTNLDAILNPLQEKIKHFEEKVDKVHLSDSKDRADLRSQIKMLHDLNQQVSKEANNLVKALKGDTKKQGNWGEIILEKILERSGLAKDLEYKMQVSITQEDGRRLQPDAVIYLPEDRHLIIDSKVSLNAYECMINAETDEDRERYLAEHIISIKNHIRNLSDKNYQVLPGLNSPDFVLLFMPIESSFGLAMQADQEIFATAWDKRIVVVSPSTLLATLRTVASIWKQEKQNRFALEIARESGKLYDKFVGFIADMQKIGNELDQARKSHDSAMNKLKDGRGNLIGKVETIRELGAKNTKTLPANLLPTADEAS